MIEPDYRKMLTEIAATTGMSYHKMAKELKLPGNYVHRVMNRTILKVTQEPRNRIAALYRRYCPTKACNPFARMIIEIKSRSDLTDQQVADQICVSLAWVLQCQSTPGFDPRVSEQDRLRALFEKWKDFS